MTMTDVSLSTAARRLRLNEDSGLYGSNRQPLIELTDDALMALIADNNKAAMQALYRRHHANIYRFTKRILGNETLAEDAVSETFVDAWRGAKGFKAQSTVSTWLYSIARHKAHSAMRRLRDQRLDDESIANLPDAADNPEDAALKTDCSRIIQRCLAQLSRAHREVINLVYYQGKPIHEVAEILCVPESTVKTRLHYARAQIERALADVGVTTFH